MASSPQRSQIPDSLIRVLAGILAEISSAVKRDTPHVIHGFSEFLSPSYGLGEALQDISCREMVTLFLPDEIT